MQLYADSGTEKFIPFARRKLAQWKEAALRSGLASFAKTIFADEGTIIYVNSLALGHGQYRDRIRITGGFGFLIVKRVLRPVLDSEGNPTFDDEGDPITYLTYELWGIDGGVATLSSTWVPGGTSWLVVRDKSHIGSFAAAAPGVTYRRGSGAGTFAARLDQFTGIDSPEFDAVVTASTYITQVITASGKSANLDTAGLISGALVVFPVSAGWIHSAPVYYVTGQQSFIGLIRVRKGGLSADKSVYAESYTWSVDSGGVMQVSPPESALTADTERTFYDGSLNYHFYWVKFGQTQWQQISMTDLSVLVPVSQESTYTAPYAYNAALAGWVTTMNPSGLGYPPRTVSFMGASLHNDVLSNGLPFFCNVWPQPVLINGVQYWWVNTQSVRSTVYFVGNIGGTDTYDYMSPHLFRWGTVVLRDGVEVSNTTQERSYVSSSDLPQSAESVPTASWDNAAPLYIYVPTDGVRVADADWMCGVRIEQIFTIISGGYTMGYKQRPAVWKADLSEVHTYADLEIAVSPTTSAERFTQNSVRSSDFFFARYKGGLFFVCFAGGDYIPYGVSMGDLDAVPVAIAAVGDTVLERRYPAVRSPGTVNSPAL